VKILKEVLGGYFVDPHCRLSIQIANSLIVHRL